MDIVGIALKYFWVLPVGAASIFVPALWHVADQEEAEIGYKRLLVGAWLWLVTPFLFMGIGIILGDLDQITMYADPSLANPYVKVFHVVIAPICLLPPGWVAFGSGATFLVRYGQPLFKAKLTESVVRISVGVVLLLQVCALVLMWRGVYRIAPPQ